MLVVIWGQIVSKKASLISPILSLKTKHLNCTFKFKLQKWHVTYPFLLRRPFGRKLLLVVCISCESVLQAFLRHLQQQEKHPYPRPRDTKCTWVIKIHFANSLYFSDNSPHNHVVPGLLLIVHHCKLWQCSWRHQQEQLTRLTKIY